ncbi:MAG: hypothetical protein FJ297_00225 [Planctomycetes bacterium]|nr:hypothetical protein [Planctomycetota bacterium]
MEARCARVWVVGIALVSLAANHRTENFIVSAPTAELAVEMGDAAEHLRRDLALEWLGTELPRWDEPCPIQAVVGSHLPAGGQTSFYFTGGRPRGWEMIVQGSRERVLDSVLPHEITHTIFASHFGRPLPRWADEGACTTVEHDSERRKQDHLLVEFLTSQPTRGIAFNDMFAMQDYPRDILPLYSQGYSLARFLIAQGGKQEFLAYVGDGMRSGNWTRATHAHYGYSSLADLQARWLRWVGEGSPPIARRAEQTVSAPTDLGRSAEEGEGIADRRPDSASPAVALRDSNGSAASWYARRRDETRRSTSAIDAERELASDRRGNRVRATSRPPAAETFEPITLEPVRTAVPFEPTIRR